MTIYGDNITKDYRKRVYIISKSKMEEMKYFEHFVSRKTNDGVSILKSVETDRYYLIEK